MKILFLNPRIDAQHKVVAALQARGVAVLIAADAEEAMQLLTLYGESIDLVSVHKEEDRGGSGMDFVARIKSDVAHSDLPVVITWENWSEAECAAHQETAQGANAYVQWPCEAASFIHVLESVLGSVGEVKDEPVSVEMEPQSDQGAHIEGVIMPLEPIELPELQTAALESGTSDLPPIPAPRGAQSLDLSQLTPAAGSAEEVMEEAVEETAQEREDLSAELVHDMPYLFKDRRKEQAPSSAPGVTYRHPIGDAVVPGGAAQAPDVETLKKYLLLREQDVAALSEQLNTAKEQVAAIESLLKEEHARSAELMQLSTEQKKRIENFEAEKAIAMEGLQTEINELRFQARAKTDKARVLENQVRDASQEMDRLKERVRLDIRKIRMREKELENRLEIMKKDSEALIGARENKIIELKRKLDLLEFNMDLLQNQFSREKDSSAQLRERLAKAAQVVRVAGGLLGTEAAESLLATDTNTGPKDHGSAA